MPENYTNVRPQMDEQKLAELAVQMKASERYQLAIRKVKLGVKNLSFLEHFGHLKALSIDEVKAGLEAVKHLENLERIGLNRMKSFKPKALRHLPHLQSLYLGCTSLASTEGIETLGQLNNLTMFSVSGLAGAEFLPHLSKLEDLDLTDCKGMSAVPNLSNLTNLTDIFISGQKDLEDISGLFTAPNLKKLTLTNVPQLDPELLRPALDHPTLEIIRPSLVGMEGAEKDERAAEILRPRFGDVNER